MRYARKFIEQKLQTLLVSGVAWIFSGLTAAQAVYGGAEQPALRRGREPAEVTQGNQFNAPTSEEAVHLSQASGGQSPVEMARTAEPRPGAGESALIDVAPPEPKQQRTEVGAPVAGDGSPRSPGSAADGSAATEAHTGGAASATKWGIPLIWGGSQIFDFRDTKLEGQPNRTGFISQTLLRARGYVWQPWFAQLNGELNFAYTDEHQGGSNQNLSVPTTGDTRSTNLLGSGTLGLFPMSRFPFTASYTEGDTRVSGDLSNFPYTTKRYAFTQGYTPQSGGPRLRLTYDRSEVSSLQAGDDIAKALGAHGNWSRGANTLSVSGRKYSNTNIATGDRSSLKTVDATHNYRSGPTFSVDSQLNYNDTDYQLTSANVPSQSGLRSLQLNSFAAWQPAVDSPLRVTGSARFYDSNSVVNGFTSDARSLSMNAGASYKFSANTTVNGGGSVTQSTSGGETNYFTTQNAGIDYLSDVSNFGKYSYSWYTGGAVGNSTGGESAQHNVSGRIGHRLFRNILREDGSAVYVNAHQTFSAINDSLRGTSQTLLNGVGGSWSRRLQENATMVMSADVSDSRTTGYGAQHFQQFNAVVSGNLTFSRWASAGANMNFQVTRQITQPDYLRGSVGSSSDRTTYNTSGNLNYIHLRAFNVARLRYEAILNLYQQQAQTRGSGDLDAPPETLDWNLEQKLNYHIGRLQMELNMRIAEVAGSTNSQVFFRIQRDFGAF